MAFPIEELRQVAARGMVLRIECRQCGNVSNFLASDVMQFASPTKRLHEIKFTCRECGTRQPKVTAIKPDWERDRGIVVWRPMKL